MPGRIHSRECTLTIVRQVASGEQRPARVCREQHPDESVLLRSTTRAVRPPSRPARGRGQTVWRASWPRWRVAAASLALENRILKKALPGAALRSDTR